MTLATVRKLRLDIGSRELEVRSGIDPDFVATLAHEIRNILSPLGSAAELLPLLELDDAAAREASSVIGRQVRRLKRLTSDLLDAHRLSHDGIRLARRRVNLCELLQTICSDYRALFDARAISLVPQWGHGPVWADIDPDRLDQVLTNLLSNSLKFTDRGGSVRVMLNANVQQRTAAISVVDTGIGMTPAVIKTVFDLHAHESSSRNRSGLGLGLPLARKLIELHGGRLEVESSGPGCGATFRVVLPLRRD
jgi:signal transduction histidine kinase